MEGRRAPASPRKRARTYLRILAATYGPAEGRRLMDGKLVDYDEKETHLPYTRDVLPFLVALVSSSGGEEEDEGHEEEGQSADPPDNDDDVDDVDSSHHRTEATFRMPPNANALELMSGRPMNVCFGDPLPGTTKVLSVEYLFLDDHVRGDGKYHRTTSRTFKSMFREHERVVLKRQDPLFRLITEDDGDAESDSSTAEEHRQFSTNGNATIHTTTGASEAETRITSTTPQSSASSLPQMQSQLHSTPALSASPSSPSKRWRLAPTTSEISLPIILPFLTVQQRAKCQLVCRSWREIVLDRGVAVVVDVNDALLFKERMGFVASTSLLAQQSSSGTASFANVGSAPTSLSMQDHPSRSILRGLLNHSHSSLESLLLNDFLPLNPSVDLHHALPHLRKLRRLDISRIPSVTDETLNLISTYIGERLEVIYMKGLRNVTNAGIANLVQSCFNIRVMDVSQVHQLDDQAGIAIGMHLVKLEVFHCRNNYKLTNASVDLITKNCRHLVQVTFWGCIRLTHAQFNNNQQPVGVANPSLQIHQPSQLKMVNLWGCHGLTDDVATQLRTLHNLQSLCVSECHRLTDQFVTGIAQSLSQLLHLQLRYLRRITDASLDVISQRVHGLYSLDVSFCTKLTEGGISKLIKERCTSLAELRLYSCRQLNLEGGNVGNERGVSEGLKLVQALKSVREVSILSFLDVRECQQNPPFARDDAFLNGMTGLSFDEVLRGLFTRRACCNADMRMRLVSALSDGRLERASGRAS